VRHIGQDVRFWNIWHAFIRRDVEPIFNDRQITDDTMNSTHVSYVILIAKPLGSLIRRRNNSVKMEVRRLCMSEPNGHGCGRLQATGFSFSGY